jgi:rhodanese-related sulfurtransferase
MKKADPIKPSTTPIKKTAWQIPLLVLLAVTLALAVNRWRADGIPLVGDWSVQARFAEAAGSGLTIALGQAWELFDTDAILFVDARPPEQYAQGHIYGALNLPWQAVDHYFTALADQLDSPKTIVAYCDGDSCDLSHELALFLLEMGFKKVRVLVNGWSLWQAAGLPTAVRG